MAGVFKRKSDAARGKRGKWTCWYIGADGKRHSFVGTTDKDASLKLANAREAEERQVREGLVDPAERTRRDASHRPARDHVEAYRLDLLAKGDKRKHANHVAGVLRRVLEDAAVDKLPDLTAERVQAALGRLRVRRSARTHNHALRAVRAFCGWLADSGRIRSVPAGLKKIPLANEGADRRRVRRTLTPDELDLLIRRTALAGATILARCPKGKGGRTTAAVTMTGRQRAGAYRLAAGTGFRASEIRALTPERFALDGDAPTVTCPAAYAKNGRDAVQPITPSLAAILREFVAATPPGEPVFPLPARTSEMLAVDLKLAEIPATTAEGVVDFHAVRHTYISDMIARGVDPKTVQVLARHSTITLTIDRYSHTDDARKRDALRRDESA